MSDRQIEGLPLGTRIKFVSLDYPKEIHPANVGVVALEPDNVYGVLDLTTVKIPQGYQRKGETVEEWFREPNGNAWLDPSFLSVIAPEWNPSGPDKRRIIVEKIKPKTKSVMVLEYDIIDGKGRFPSWEQNTVSSFEAQGWVRAKRGNARIEERAV